VRLPLIGLLGLTLLTAAISGCDPGISIEGTVRTAGGSPVPAAAISIRCPERFPFDPASSDAQGRFSLQRLGCLPRACVVEAKLGDGKVASMTVDSACKDTVFLCSKNSCNFIKGDLVFRE
jgi:hypothetical protein